MKNSKAVFAWSAGWVWLAAGCGGAGGLDLHTVPVSGTVFLDGAPLAGAHVHFVSEKFQGFATTAADGSYELVQGAVPGTNRVFIQKLPDGDAHGIVPGFGQDGLDEGQLQAALDSQMREPRARTGKPRDAGQLLPPEFSDPERTKLTYLVPDDGTAEAGFRLSTNSASAATPR